MTLAQGILFLLCVALATWAQALTGFAFALILLGLVGLMELVPLADAANVASVLSLVQAIVVLKGSRKSLDLQVLRDTLIGSVFGVAAGVFLLGWLSGNVVMLLRLLLGLTILGCAAILVLQAQPLAQRSPPAVFRAYGVVAGLMSGLFSTAGPPLVYHLYRQPMNPVAVRQTLVMIFGASSVLRLALVVPAGQFGWPALGLSLLATPLVVGLSWWMRRHPPGWSPRVVRSIVCVLLVLAGAALAVPALVHYL
jgi:uncharacterized membrane protein YfcA